MKCKKGYDGEYKALMNNNTGACKTREKMKVIRNNRYTSEVQPEWDNIKTQC